MSGGWSKHPLCAHGVPAEDFCLECSANAPASLIDCMDSRLTPQNCATPCGSCSTCKAFQAAGNPRRVMNFDAGDK